MIKKEKCCVLKCERAAYIQKHKLCFPHYQKYRKYGDPLLGNKNANRRLEPYRPK